MLSVASFSMEELFGIFSYTEIVLMITIMHHSEVYFVFDLRFQITTSSSCSELCELMGL